MATIITAGLGAMLFLFYQGFVRGNLYGGTTGAATNANELFLSPDDRAMGLENVVANPFP